MARKEEDPRFAMEVFMQRLRDEHEKRYGHSPTRDEMKRIERKAEQIATKFHRQKWSR